MAARICRSCSARSPLASAHCAACGAPFDPRAGRQSTAQRVALVGAFVVALGLGVALVWSNLRASVPAASPAGSPTASPAVVAAPPPGAPAAASDTDETERQRLREYLAEVSRVADECLDHIRRANATPKSELSGVVGELQSLRRSFAEVVPPAAAGATKTEALAALDLTVDGYLEFMGSGNSVGDDYQGRRVALDRLGQANDRWKRALDEANTARWKAGLPTE